MKPKNRAGAAPSSRSDGEKTVVYIAWYKASTSASWEPVAVALTSDQALRRGQDCTSSGLLRVLACRLAAPEPIGQPRESVKEQASKAKEIGESRRLVSRLLSQDDRDGDCDLTPAQYELEEWIISEGYVPADRLIPFTGRKPLDARDAGDILYEYLDLFPDRARGQAAELVEYAAKLGTLSRRELSEDTTQ